MKKLYLNRKLFAVHSWLGLFLGIFYFLISVSGALSVFRFELNSLVYGRKMDFAEQPAKKRISYDTLYSIARKEFPGVQYYVCGFDWVYSNRPGFFSGVDHDMPKLFTGSMQYRVNYVNPYTAAQILRTNSNGKNNVIDWIMGFHYSFALGEGGEGFVVLLDIALMLSLITGFVFYRKYILPVLLFKVKVKFTNWRMASSGLHRVVGVWALLFNILIFLSGLYIQKKFFVSKWWEKYTHSAMAMPEHHPALEYPSAGVSLDSLVMVSKKIAPQMTLQGFSVDCGNQGNISAFGTPSEKMFLGYDNFMDVNFDKNGKYLNSDYKPWKSFSGTEKFENINFALLHTGWALGTPGKIIWCIMGFSPAFLSFTGFLLWWRKRKTKSNRKSYRRVPA